MRFSNRKEFLEKAKDELVGPNMDKIFYILEKAVKTNNPKLLDYDKIVKIGAKSQGKKIDEKEYAELLKKTYAYWYNHALKERHENAETTWQKESIEEFLNNDELKPENIKGDEIFDVCSYFEDRMIGGLKFPTYFQGEYFCHLYANDLTIDRKKKEKFAELRLYLKINVENVVKLADVLIDKALENNVPLLLKIALMDGRNDNMVFYTDYDNVEAVANLIDTAKNENPNLFEGCKVKNPLMATYKKYIGFGEEPFLFGSYNSVRVDAMQDAFKALKKEYDKNPEFLTKENIEKQFKESCEDFWIDGENLCMNTKERYKEYEMI